MLQKAHKDCALFLTALAGGRGREVPQVSPLSGEVPAEQGEVSVARQVTGVWKLSANVTCSQAGFSSGRTASP